MFATSTFGRRRMLRSGTTPRRTVSRLFLKDTDFRERSFVEGFPPKVIWLDVGNASTAPIGALLRNERPRIETFAAATDASLLILSIGDSAV